MRKEESQQEKQTFAQPSSAVKAVMGIQNESMKNNQSEDKLIQLEMM